MAKISSVKNPAGNRTIIFGFISMPSSAVAVSPRLILTLALVVLAFGQRHKNLKITRTANMADKSESAPGRQPLT
ncbi:hypothetical protein [uncultured Fructobacillus sp.]|uniref:hypothetical protein n=1 Tax=uncultured Fructobacillus sp. TaxID=591942 RepID=UPI0025944FC8|nr:hypothetical protein [uncultured Fructobacillus sp.]